MTEERICPLRERMIEDMRIRGMGEKAQKSHMCYSTYEGLASEILFGEATEDQPESLLQTARAKTREILAQPAEPVFGSETNSEIRARFPEIRDACSTGVRSTASVSGYR